MRNLVLRKFIILLSIVAFLSLSSILYAKTDLISIEAKDEEISKVLSEIAEDSNMNLIVSRDVIGRVTVKLKNVSLEEALKAILQPSNLTYKIDGDVISISTYSEYQQRQRFCPLKTEVFTLQNIKVTALRRAFMSMKSPRGKVELNLKGNQVIITDTPEKIKEIKNVLKKIDKKREIRKYKLEYADAEEIKEKLLKIITEDMGEVFVDDRTNSIVIKAASSMLQGIDGLIEGWDVQHQQVFIEARILQVTLDKKDERGIEWGSNLTLRGNLQMDLTKGGGDIFTIGTLTADEYKMTLKMLESNTNTEILSNPRLVVIDNHEANILVGSMEPYIVTTKDPDTGWTIEETKFKEVGLKLIVTPKIGEDNFITLTIHPEVSTARRVTEVNNALAIDTTQADTTMMVKDGETIVLGGLMKDSKAETYRKVPLLGDIPLLGYLFRSRDIKNVKTELIVFITPHILTNQNREFISRKDIRSTIKRSRTTLDVLPKDLIFEQE